MQPIPETAQVIEEFRKFGVDLGAELDRKASALKKLVPELVGFSVAALTDDITFTLVATDDDVAVQDAVQSLAGEPCQDAPRAEHVVESSADQPDDERSWHTFARATAATAVATTLTLPILEDEKVVGSVNLYAAAPEAFCGLHAEIARIFHAWAPGAVTNADLSFDTRRTAERAPAALRAAARVEAAVGILMEAEALDEHSARGMLVEAAQRAGVPLDLLADAVVDLFERRDDA